jgi:hypothetical protein
MDPNLTRPPIVLDRFGKCVFFLKLGAVLVFSYPNSEVRRPTNVQEHDGEVPGRDNLREMSEYGHGSPR